MQQQQRARPVDRFGDCGHLLQIEAAQFVNEVDQLSAQLRQDLRHACVDDALLQLHVRERNVQVQAATLQRVGNLARVVAGQKDQRRLGFGFDGADLRNRHLVVRKDLEQQRFEFVVRLVDFVDQQDAAVLFLQRLQQRTRFDEFLGEEDVAEFVQPADRLLEALRALQNFVECFLEYLRVQQLLAVLPLVQRFGFVETFVALQADQRHAEHRGGGFRELGLADARRPFDEHRFFQVEREVHGSGDLVAADVAVLLERLPDRFDR